MKKLFTCLIALALVFAFTFFSLTAFKANASQSMAAAAVPQAPSFSETEERAPPAQARAAPHFRLNRSETDKAQNIKLMKPDFTVGAKDARSRDRPQRC